MTQKEFKNTLYGNTDESKSLRKKLMSKAKVVEPGSDMHRMLNDGVEEEKKRYYRSTSKMPQK